MSLRWYVCKLCEMMKRCVIAETRTRIVQQEEGVIQYIAARHASYSPT